MLGRVCTQGSRGVFTWRVIWPFNQLNDLAQCVLGKETFYFIRLDVVRGIMGNLRYWALVGYTPRGLQVVQCNGWIYEVMDDNKVLILVCNERIPFTHVHVVREPRHAERAR